MNAVFHLDSSELDESFLAGVTWTFQNRRWKYEVRDTDDTEQLPGSAANRRELIPDLVEAQTGRSVMAPDQAARDIILPACRHSFGG